MLATGVAGGYGTYSNIAAAYGPGTALGAVAAGEGATAVLALVLLGLTLLGQSSPAVVRAGLWALPAAASLMSAMAAPDGARTVIYAITPMGMTISAEGMAFLARRIVVHTDGRDAESEARDAATVRALAYHRARAASHPSASVRRRSDRASWRLARRIGAGDVSLGGRLVDVQRTRIIGGADAALAAMFGATMEAPVITGPTPAADTAQPIDPANAEESTQDPTKRSTSDLPGSSPVVVRIDRITVPDPIDPTATKSAPIVKAPAVASGSGRRAIGADGRRPRAVTGRVPDAARTARPRRTPDQLLAEARTLTADWPDDRLTAEGIRRELHISPATARRLRDTIRTDRTGGGTHGHVA
ncbi:conjugal transfer protein [Streptomyces sp. NPDC020875]|uniref:conjugal transfer protein n=1 Tax=Streptomyces sp. NPDC020875 TaxID=3154898 RepID=UPI0033E6A247